MLADLMPEWLAGLLLAGILAAIMSTVDSQLLVLTGSVSEDILHKSFGWRLTEKQLVRASRLTVIGAGLLGLLIALTSEKLVYTVVSWAWAGVGCTFSAAIVLTLLEKVFRRCHRRHDYYRIRDDGRLDQFAVGGLVYVAGSHFFYCDFGGDCV